MISKQSIDKILQRIDIIDVLTDFISLKKRGVNWIGLCPFHGERSPSFTVSPSKQIYKCFGCGKSGSAISFLMDHEKHSYPEALRWLAHKYQIEIEETEQTEESKKLQEKNNSIFALNQFATDFFHRQLFHTSEGKQIALGYLEERKISLEISQRFFLGFCPDSPSHNMFYLEAKKQQFQDDILLSSGLVKKRNDDFIDAYAGRIIFPIHLPNGKVAGFGARKISSQDEKSPKYINTPQNETYNKSQILYGFHLAREQILKKKFAILVEGYTDVLALHQIEHENVVATAGTALTQEQVFLVKKITNKILICYDGDAAGKTATLKAIHLFLAQGIEVEVLVLPLNEDPDSFAHQHQKHSFQQYLQQHTLGFLDYLIKTLSTDNNNVQEKSNAANTIAETLSNFHRVEDLIKRQEYTKYASEKLSVDLESLHRLVNLHLRNKAFSKEQDEDKSSIPSEPAKAQTSLHLKNPLDDQFLDDNIKHLILLLILFGHKHWENGINVAQHIFNTLQQSSIIAEIKNPTLSKILDEYKMLIDRGEFMLKEHLIYHQDQHIRQQSIEIFVELEKPNKGWKNILPDYDEDELYHKEVHTTLCLLILKLIKKFIHENQKWGKHQTDEEMNNKVTLDAHKELKKWEMQVANEMGITMMR